MSSISSSESYEITNYISRDSATHSKMRGILQSISSEQVARISKLPACPHLHMLFVTGQRIGDADRTEGLGSEQAMLRSMLQFKPPFIDLDIPFPSGLC